MGWFTRFCAAGAVLLVIALSPGTPRAATPACVHLLGESADWFAVTIQANCDLREVARLFPQIDPETKQPLAMQDQLRSIYALNESRFTEGKAKFRTVGRACVPAGQAPTFATPEELEICPRGLVNYFGVASLGNQAVIAVPKNRTLTQAERLQDLTKAACTALAAASRAPLNAAAQEALAACRKVLGDDAVPEQTTAAPNEATPSEAPPERVKALTLELENKQKRIEQLERAKVQPWTAKPSEDRGLYVIVLVVAIAVIGSLATAWQRRRNAAKAAKAQPAVPKIPSGTTLSDGRVVVDKETLARALADIERGFQTQLETERVQQQERIEEQRSIILELERQLRERLSVQERESAQDTGRKRGSRERERGLESELARLREEHQQELQKRDQQLASLQQANEEALRIQNEQIAQLQQQFEAGLRAREEELSILQQRHEEQLSLLEYNANELLVERDEQIAHLRARSEQGLEPGDTAEQVVDERTPLARALDLQRRDAEMENLTATTRSLEKRVAILSADLLREQKRAASLRTRLKAAKGRAEANPPPSRPRFAGAGGLQAPSAEGRLSVAAPA